MISYIDTLQGIDSNVQPFYERLAMRPYTGTILRNYDRQSGAP